MSFKVGTEVVLFYEYPAWADFTVPAGTTGIVVPGKPSSTYINVRWDLEFPSKVYEQENEEGLLMRPHEIGEV